MSFTKAAAIAAGGLALMSTASPLFAQGKEFPDVPPDHWAAQAVKLLEDRGIVIGYPNGTYGGPRAMTRYEFAEAIARLINQIDEKMKAGIAQPGATATDMSEYVKKTDLPDFSQFVKRPELDAYVTKTDLDNRLKNLVTTDQLNAALALKADKADVYTKSEADAKFALKSDLDRLEAMLNEFQKELTAMGVDVQALKQKYALLDARVTELEKLRVFGNGVVAWKASRQFYGGSRGQIFAGVDRDGSLLDTGNFIDPTHFPSPGTVPLPNDITGKRDGLFQNPSVLYDSQIGIQYQFNPGLRAVAQFIMGNYWGAWQEQQAYSAGFGGGTPSTSALSLQSNRSPGSLSLQAYEAYLQAPFKAPVFPNSITNGAFSVGRIPTRMTRYTWWAVDPDTYIDVPREDSGNITLTGAAIGGDISDDLTLSVFGGYNPTDGTAPWTFQSPVDTTRNGTIGFGHYVRPGGSQTYPIYYPNTNRTHLDSIYYRIPTINSMAAVRLALPYIGVNYLVGVGDDWRNPALQIGTFAGANVPIYNRFAQVFSVDWSTSIPVKRISPHLPVFGFQGEIAMASANNYGASGVQTSGTYTSINPAGTAGATATVASSKGNAEDFKITFPIGPTNWSLGSQSISPGYMAPGYWGQLGSWVNPWNYTTDSPLYLKSGNGSGRFLVPIIPTALGLGIPFTGVPYIGDLAFTLNASVGRMATYAKGFPTPYGPSTGVADITDPDHFRITHTSMALGFGAGKDSGYKFGLSAEDTLRDYPAEGGLKHDITFLWQSLKSLVNVRGGSGAHQPSTFNDAKVTFGTPTYTGNIPTPQLLGGPIQSDENYYTVSIGKNLTPDGSALAKLLFQRVIYNDRLSNSLVGGATVGNSGGSYRGDIATAEVTYKF